MVINYEEKPFNVLYADNMSEICQACAYFNGTVNGQQWYLLNHINDLGHVL